MKTILIIILTCLCFIAAKAEDERIFIDGKINNKSARFIFDTGVTVPFVLFSTSAQRLGLKVTLSPADAQIGPGQIAGGYTELCDLNIAGTNVATCFRVLENPAYLKWSANGVLGWPAVSNNIFSIDFINHTFAFFTNIPAESLTWI